MTVAWQLAGTVDAKRHDLRLAYHAGPVISRCHTTLDRGPHQCRMSVCRRAERDFAEVGAAAVPCARAASDVVRR